MQKFWLFKSEPQEYSIDSLKKDKNCLWEGVRNYQARNFMRDECHKGDLVLFYHSSCKEVGIAGVAKIAQTGLIDPSQFDQRSPYYDPKSSESSPRWVCVKIEFVRKFEKVISLKTIKNLAQLKDMLLVQKGSRLSVQPVKKEHFDFILNELAKNV